MLLAARWCSYNTITSTDFSNFFRKKERKKEFTLSKEWGEIPLKTYDGIFSSKSNNIQTMWHPSVHCSHASALKDWLRVYTASRGSDGHEASKPLQIIFLKSGSDRVSNWNHSQLIDNNRLLKKTHYTGTSYLMVFYCLIVFKVINFQ